MNPQTEMLPEGRKYTGMTQGRHVAGIKKRPAHSMCILCVEQGMMKEKNLNRVANAVREA